MPQAKDVNRAETLLDWAVEDVIAATSVTSANRVRDRVVELADVVSIEWAKEALAASISKHVIRQVQSCTGVIMDNLED